jgi:hypothetical protein
LKRFGRETVNSRLVGTVFEGENFLQISSR